MELGIFEHIERRELPLAQQYEDRLRLLERYDAAGFYSYHLAEHHATPLGMAPVPGLFLAAAAQRTRRMRLGPCVYLLPLYDPLRLIEEICMLDHLTHGRFDLGVGRGAVPYEIAYFGLNHLETPEIYREALEVLLKGLTSEVLDHRGRRYSYRNVPMVLRPLQQPHPPLWYGLGNLPGAEWAASNRVNVITNAPPETARTLFDRYREVWRSTHADEPLPKLGLGRHILVAPTEAEALALARPNYAAWYGNVTKLWRDFGALPIRFIPELDEARKRGLAIVGTPEQVLEAMRCQIGETGCTYFACRFSFGDLSDEQAAASLELFAAELMPKVVAGESETSVEGCRQRS